MIAKRIVTSTLVLMGMSFQAGAFESAPVMNLDTATKIAEGCRAKAAEKGWKMSVTVVDAGANPIYFQRMDAAYLGSAELSKLKAENAAKMQMPTRLFEELSFGKDHKGGGLVPGLAHLPGFVSMAGGVPIKTSAGFLGAVGVSGGFPDEDEACAMAGLDAVKNLLK